MTGTEDAPGETGKAVCESGQGHFLEPSGNWLLGEPVYERGRFSCGYEAARSKAFLGRVWVPVVGAGVLHWDQGGLLHWQPKASLVLEEFQSSTWET